MAGGLGGTLRDLLTFRIIPNRPQRSGIAQPLAGAPGSAFLVIEFDDQGLLFDEGDIAVLDRHLDALADSNPVIVVFAHGWKHDARPDDSFLVTVHQMLQEAAAGTERPVLGIYLAWRGLSLAGDPIWADASFWGRQSAAERVAVGTPREVLGRLRRFRNGPDGASARASLLIVGHSFGGLIVYTAIAQSLIDAAASTGSVVPSYGDLVLLINPAFSAISYLPIAAIVARRSFEGDQLPVFVAVTARNDDATRVLYPLGEFFRPLTEATRTRQEREALTRTIGHLRSLQTHTLAVAPPGASPTSDPARALRLLCRTEARETIGGVLVTATGQKQGSPFWVASATAEIVDGHDGIFLPRFRSFVTALLAAHATTPKPVARA